MKTLISTLSFIVLFVTNSIAGQGVYLEYQISATGKTGMSGTIKTYALDGNSRSEMAIQVGAGITMVTLFKKDVPDTMYLLNEKNKTYSASSTHPKGTASKADEDYEITVIGKEKVNNYNATHIKILYKKTNKTVEMWMSKDFPNYAEYKGVKSQYVEGDKFYKALEAKGADGMPVRIVANEERGAMQMDLVKAEKATVDATMFSLSGYTHSANAGPAGIDRKEIMKNIQNMTPEERQKYAEELKKQYQRK